MRNTVTLVSAILLVCSPAISSEICAKSPRLVGTCFVVHGRLMQTNGTPDARIWRIGTKRILGVVDAKGQADTDDAVPERLGPWDRDLDGDFRVCPLTHERPGWMQMVCIAGWSKVVRARNSN